MATFVDMMMEPVVKKMDHLPSVCTDKPLSNVSSDDSSDEDMYCSADFDFETCTENDEEANKVDLQEKNKSGKRKLDHSSNNDDHQKKKKEKTEKNWKNEKKGKKRTSEKMEKASKLQKTTAATEDGGPGVSTQENAGEQLSLSTSNNKRWGDYCHLPKLKGKNGSRFKTGSVVSMDQKMIYQGPLTPSQARLLKFKSAVLHDIVADQHTPEFSVSADVLSYPLFNHSLMATTDGHVIEMGQTSRLGSQSKGLLCEASCSVLKHCLGRYILDMGDTGIYNMMFDLETKTWINPRFDKTWGNSATLCKDKIVRFFESRMSLESSLISVRCMVLNHKPALLEFLDELDMTAVQRAAECCLIPTAFVQGMKGRMEQIRSVLSDFETKDLLSV